MHYMTLLKRFMLPQDCLLTKHREKFEKNNRKTEYGRFISVKAVRETGIVDEVFCCTEMETHTFVVGNGVLSGNCYGNSIVSVIPTFTRYLSCPQCKSVELPLRQAMDEPLFRFVWSNYQFTALCPKCGYQGAWPHTDRSMGAHGGFRIKRWIIHDIELLWDPWSDEVRHIWKIPEDYRRLVREGKPHILEHVPVKVVDAVKNNNHLLFEKDFVYHMKEDALAGILNRGWGVSRVLTNFRQAWYVQVLHRYNEAIALDYVIPFRLITPEKGDTATGDVLNDLNAGSHMAQVHQMLRRRRRDPATWHTLPFAVKYQALGGDAKQLAPTELLSQGLDVLLNGVGIPAELYKGTMTAQTMPMGLRLFEASQSSIPHNFNALLHFIARKSAAMLRWEPVTAYLTRVTHADDAQRQMMHLQLATAGQASQSTGLAAVGLRYKDEIRQQMADQQFQAEEQAKLQETMEQSSAMKQLFQNPAQQAGVQGGQGGQQQGGQSGGQQAQGGQPGQAPAGQSIVAGLPQGPNQQISPEELLQRAQYVASQLMGAPESQKDSELIALKKSDSTLWAQVKAIMNDMRQKAKTQGGSQVLAQTFGKQGSNGELSIDVTRAYGVQKRAGSVRRTIRFREPAGAAQ
jgi:hypothetical protein